MIPFTVISATNGSTALINGAITTLGGDIGGRDENTAGYERRPQAEGDEGPGTHALIYYAHLAQACKPLIGVSLFVFWLPSMANGEDNWWQDGWEDNSWDRHAHVAAYWSAP